MSLKIRDLNHFHDHELDSLVSMYDTGTSSVACGTHTGVRYNEQANTTAVAGSRTVGAKTWWAPSMPRSRACVTTWT